jgi:quinol-cytochrome oxidoreductase complex cytochrome b subunit
LLSNEEIEKGQNIQETDRVVIHYSTEGKVITKKTHEAEVHHNEIHDEHDYSGLEVIPFVPHHALKEAIAASIFLIIAFVFVAIVPAPLEAKANSFESPTGVKPEWYFMAPFELMHLMPPLPGMMVQGVAIGLFVILPFLDRKPRPIMTRKILFPLSILALAVQVMLTVSVMLKTE